MTVPHTVLFAGEWSRVLGQEEAGEMSLSYYDELGRQVKQKSSRHWLHHHRSPSP